MGTPEMYPYKEHVVQIDPPRGHGLRYVQIFNLANTRLHNFYATTSLEAVNKAQEWIDEHTDNDAE